LLVASQERVHALDPATGVERWSLAIPKSFVAAAATADGFVFAASDPGARCSS
jgi:hypothetical protein